jgi:hypothetical protein
MNKVKKYEDQLMRVLRFDEDDLEANRAGTLSTRQVADLKAERRSQIFWLVFFSLLYLGVVSLILMRSNLNSPLALSLIGAVVVGIGVVGIGVAGFGYVTRIKPLGKDIRENKALAVDGRADLSLKRQGSQIKYALAVGKLRFPIQKDEFLSFKNRDPYCVYYTPHSKRILSVEWLHDDQPFVTDEDEDEDVIVPPKRRQAY